VILNTTGCGARWRQQKRLVTQEEEPWHNLTSFSEVGLAHAVVACLSALESSGADRFASVTSNEIHTESVAQFIGGSSRGISSSRHDEVNGAEKIEHCLLSVAAKYAL
jgi:hypothetical protein